MLVKAEGTFKQVIIIDSASASLGRASNKVRSIVFYGRTLASVNSWLTGQTHKTVLTEDETVNVYHGEYEKMIHGQTEHYDSMKFRHVGFGTAAVGAAADQDLAGAVVGAGMDVSGLRQSRAFVAFVGFKVGQGMDQPKLMYHQTKIALMRTLVRGPEPKATIDISTGFLTLTVNGALRIANDPNAGLGDKFNAKMFLHLRKIQW